jgi:hypothetical protein
LALWIAPSARACNTPVFRYAMYNWPPAPFFVFYFHHAESPAEDEKVNALIAELAETGPAVANVLLEPVDVSAGEVEKLPKPVKDAWQAYLGETPDSAEVDAAEPKGAPPQSEEAETKERNSEEPRSAEPKSDEPKSPEPKSPEPKSPEPKSDEPNRDEPISSQPKRPEPVHIVFTSWGAPLHEGRLDEATVRALVESPMRTKVGQLLKEGCAAVMVFLPGSNAEENKEAEKIARDVIAEAGAGKIPVESGYLDATFGQWGPPGEAVEGEDAEDAMSEEERIAEASRLKLGFVKLDRSDDAEKWLVRSLMAMEHDLKELTEHPMVFFAYGRGRAMPPFVGKGINAENLAAEIQFLASACSCFVKDQNPGADLLMRWDWEATADAMAAKDPTMFGGPMAYEEFYADEPVEPDEPVETVASAGPEATAQVAAAVPGSPSPPDEAASSDPEATGAEASDNEMGDSEATGSDVTESEATGATNGSAAADTGVAAALGAQAGKEEPPASQPTSVSGDADAVPVAFSQPEQGGSFASRQMWTLGIGLVLAAVVVLGAGSVLMVKRATAGGRAVP